MECGRSVEANPSSWACMACTSHTNESMVCCGLVLAMYRAARLATDKYCCTFCACLLGVCLNIRSPFLSFFLVFLPFLWLSCVHGIHTVPTVPRTLSGMLSSSPLSTKKSTMWITLFFWPASVLHRRSSSACSAAPCPSVTSYSAVRSWAPHVPCIGVMVVVVVRCMTGMSGTNRGLQRAGQHAGQRAGQHAGPPRTLQPVAGSVRFSAQGTRQVTTL